MTHGAGVVSLRYLCFRGSQRSFLVIGFVERPEDFPGFHLYNYAAVFDVFVFVDAVVTDDGFSGFFPVLVILDAL